MTNYVPHRLLLVIPTLLGVSLVIFFIRRMMPGDVARQILTGGGSGQGVTEEQVAKLRQELGLNAPLPVQYVPRLSRMAHLDPGNSLRPSHDKISDLVLERAPVKSELAIGAALVGLLIAVPLGIASALYQNSWIDSLCIVSMAGLSVPIFWMVGLAIILMNRTLGDTPPIEPKSLWVDSSGYLQKIFTPVLIIGYSYAAIVSQSSERTTRQPAPLGRLAEPAVSE
jgi:peptide/nickel transport system permease protein